MASKEPYPFTPEIERSLVRQSLADPTLLLALEPYVKPARLKTEHARLILEASLGYMRKYQEVPTITVVLQEVRKQVESGAVTLDKVSECAAYYDASHDMPPVTSRYVMDQVFASERKAAMWDALDSGLRLYRQGEMDEIVAGIERANSIGRMDMSPGTEVAASLGDRTAERLSGRLPIRWPTGIQALDDVLVGGLAPGELGCVLGVPKGGKSQCLGHIARHTAFMGGTAVVISLEMGERALADRDDAAISGVPIRALAREAAEVQTKVAGWFRRSGGRIFSKYMPPRETTCREIRAYLQHLRATRSAVPTVLCVDYGDLLGSSSSEFEKRHEELGMVYTELRALGGHLGIPVWTASQAKREALTQKVIGPEQVGESFKKVAICDVLLAICRTEEERAASLLRLYVAACRFAADGGILGPFSTAFDTGRFVATGQVVDDI